MQLEKPYFMENEDWYRFDEKEFKYVLTDVAPKKAVDSYNDFYKHLNMFDYDDEDDDM